MSTIANLRKRIEGIELHDAVHESLEETAGDIAELNKDQMYAGISRLGRKIEPQYKSPAYARKKNRMNPAPGFGTPDIKLTGNLYKSYQVKVNDTTIEESSEVPYAKYVEENYTNTIFGMTDENKAAYTAGPFWSVLKQKLKATTMLAFT